MIHLTYSNHTEPLLNYLAQSIQIEYQLRTPWEPIQLIVPNPTIKNYVRIQLTKRLGIAANLHFSYLEDIGQNLLSAKNYRILNVELINAALLGILGDINTLTKNCLVPVRNYLNKDFNSLRLVQLASQLADLYNDYDLNRPDWIKSWRKKRHISVPSCITETWQQYLWLKAINALDKTGIQHITLSEAASMPTLTLNNSCSNIYAFGFTNLAKTYYQTFAKIGELGNLYLYTVNPCQEFWEDLTIDLATNLKAPQEQDKHSGSKMALNQHSDTSEVPEALRHLGQAGRKGIKLLNNISQYNFETYFQLSESKTLLGNIQNDALFFENSSKLKQYEIDTSINFWSCPNQCREVEVLATEIWRLIELYSNTSKPLSFSDIAVVIPQNKEEVYIANIQTAFKETHDIPWTQKNYSSSALAKIMDATKLLVELPTSFAKIDIMRTITHPVIAKHFGTIKNEMWTKIFHYLDTIRKIGNCNDTVANIDQENPNNKQMCPILNPSFSKKLVFRAHNESENHKKSTTSDSTIECIQSEIKALLDDANQLQCSYKEPKHWAASLKNYLLTWLPINDKATAIAIEQIFNGLNITMESAPTGLVMPKLGYRAIQFLVIESIIKLRNQQTCNLTGGVVVSSLSQICSIPFSIVFVLGLGEGSILKESKYNSLNLRLSEYNPCDISKLEEEQYLFLEILILTKERLYLSYVAQDQLTGTLLEPSNLFQVLIKIAKDYWKVSPTVQHHPIHRFDPKYFPELFPVKELTQKKYYNYSPIAHSEAKALWLRESTFQHQLSTSLLSTKIDLATSLGLKIQINAGLNHQQVLINNNDNYYTTLHVTDLIKWLECPLTGASAIRLGLRNEAIDKIPIEDEVFASRSSDTRTLLREIALYSARNSCLPEDIYDETIKKLQNQGRSPIGLFAQIEKNSNLALIHAWLTLMQKARPKILYINHVKSSNDNINSQSQPILLKVQIKGRERLIKLIGRLRPQLWHGSIFFEIGKPTKSNLITIQKKALRAYVDQIILSYATNNTIEHHAWFLFSGGDGSNPEVQSIAFRPICANKSRILLASWIQDIFENNQEILMPIEAILSANNKEHLTEQYINNYVETHINNESGGFSSLYGPVPNLCNYNPPKNPLKIVNKRLADFLEQTLTFDIWK